MLFSLGRQFYRFTLFICNIHGPKIYDLDTNTWNRHNVYKIFINIYRNPKTRNWFRYETFIHLFEFKCFSTWGERERESFYADCFYNVSSQPNQRTAPVAHKFVWPRPALNLDSLVRRQELSSLLFLKSQNPQPTLPVRDVTHIPWSQFLSEILFWHLWMTNPPRAHVNTCVHVAPN